MFAVARLVYLGFRRSFPVLIQTLTTILVFCFWISLLQKVLIFEAIFSNWYLTVLIWDVIFFPVLPRAFLTDICDHASITYPTSAMFCEHLSDWSSWFGYRWLSRPRGYKTGVHSQTQNKAQWLAACGHVYASSQSLRFILSLRLYLSLITWRPGFFKPFHSSIHVVFLLFSPGYPFFSFLITLTCDWVE